MAPSLFDIMGRRAKNKQGPPAALEPAPSTSKRLGKRKAGSEYELEVKPSTRPSKKSKDSISKVVTQRAKSRDPVKPKKGAVDYMSNSDDAGGWEDVEDGRMSGS